MKMGVVKHRKFSDCRPGELSVNGGTSLKPCRRTKNRKKSRVKKVFLKPEGREVILKSIHKKIKNSVVASKGKKSLVKIILARQKVFSAPRHSGERVSQWLFNQSTQKHEESVKNEPNMIKSASEICGEISKDVEIVDLNSNSSDNNCSDLITSKAVGKEGAPLILIKGKYDELVNVTTPLAYVKGRNSPVVECESNCIESQVQTPSSDRGGGNQNSSSVLSDNMSMEVVSSNESAKSSSCLDKPVNHEILDTANSKRCLVGHHHGKHISQHRKLRQKNQIKSGGEARRKLFQRFYLRNNQGGYHLALKKFKKRKKSLKSLPAQSSFKVVVSNSAGVANANQVPMEIIVNKKLPANYRQLSSPANAKVLVNTPVRRNLTYCPKSTVVSCHVPSDTSFEFERLPGNRVMSKETKQLENTKEDLPSPQGREVCYIFALLDREKEEFLFKSSPQLKSHGILQQFASVIDTIATDQDILVSEKSVSGSHIEETSQASPSQAKTDRLSISDTVQNVHVTQPPNSPDADAASSNQENSLEVENDGECANQAEGIIKEAVINTTTKVIISQALLSFTSELKILTDISIRLLSWMTGTIHGDIDSDTSEDKLEGFFCHCHDKVSILIEVLSILDSKQILNLDEVELRRFWLLHDAVCCMLKAYRFVQCTSTSPSLNQHLISLITTCAKMILPSEKLNIYKWNSLLTVVYDIGVQLGESEALPETCKCYLYFSSLTTDRSCRVCNVDFLHQNMCKPRDSPVFMQDSEKKHTPVSCGVTVVEQLFPRFCQFLGLIEEWSEEEFKAALSKHSVVKFSCNIHSGLYPCSTHLCESVCRCFSPISGGETQMLSEEKVSSGLSGALPSDVSVQKNMDSFHKTKNHHTAENEINTVQDPFESSQQNVNEGECSAKHTDTVETLEVDLCTSSSDILLDQGKSSGKLDDSKTRGSEPSTSERCEEKCQEEQGHQSENLCSSGVQTSPKMENGKESESDVSNKSATERVQESSESLKIQYVETITLSQEGSVVSSDEFTLCMVESPPETENDHPQQASQEQSSSSGSTVLTDDTSKFLKKSGEIRSAFLPVNHNDCSDTAEETSTSSETNYSPPNFQKAKPSNHHNHSSVPRTPLPPIMGKDLSSTEDSGKSISDFLSVVDESTEDAFSDSNCSEMMRDVSVRDDSVFGENSYKGLISNSTMCVNKDSIPLSDETDDYASPYFESQDCLSQQKSSHHDRENQNSSLFSSPSYSTVPILSPPDKKRDSDLMFSSLLLSKGKSVLRRDGQDEAVTVKTHPKVDHTTPFLSHQSVRSLLGENVGFEEESFIDNLSHDYQVKRFRAVDANPQESSGESVESLDLPEKPERTGTRIISPALLQPLDREKRSMYLMEQCKNRCGHTAQCYDQFLEFQGKLDCGTKFICLNHGLECQEKKYGGERKVKKDESFHECNVQFYACNTENNQVRVGSKAQDGVGSFPSAEKVRKKKTAVINENNEKSVSCRMLTFHKSILAPRKDECANLNNCDDHQRPRKKVKFAMGVNCEHNYHECPQCGSESKKLHDDDDNQRNQKKVECSVGVHCDNHKFGIVGTVSKHNNCVVTDVCDEYHLNKVDSGKKSKRREGKSMHTDDENKHKKRDMRGNNSAELYNLFCEMSQREGRGMTCREAEEFGMEVKNVLLKNSESGDVSKKEKKKQSKKVKISHPLAVTEVLGDMGEEEILINDPNKADSSADILTHHKKKKKQSRRKQNGDNSPNQEEKSFLSLAMYMLNQDQKKSKKMKKTRSKHNGEKTAKQEEEPLLPSAMYMLNQDQKKSKKMKKTRSEHNGEKTAIQEEEPLLPPAMNMALDTLVSPSNGKTKSKRRREEKPTEIGPNHVVTPFKVHGCEDVNLESKKRKTKSSKKVKGTANEGDTNWESYLHCLKKRILE